MKKFCTTLLEATLVIRSTMRLYLKLKKGGGGLQAARKRQNKWPKMESQIMLQEQTFKKYLNFEL